MAVGIQHTIKFHEDDTGTVQLDVFMRKEFTHDSSFTVPVVVVTKNDFQNTPNDAFVVQTSYPLGTEPATSRTTAQILQYAKDQVNTQFGDGEAGAPT